MRPAPIAGVTGRYWVGKLRRGGRGDAGGSGEKSPRSHAESESVAPWELARALISLRMLLE